MKNPIKTFKVKWVSWKHSKIHKNHLARMEFSPGYRRYFRELNPFYGWFWVAIKNHKDRKYQKSLLPTEGELIIGEAVRRTVAQDREKAGGPYQADEGRFGWKAGFPEEDLSNRVKHKDVREILGAVIEERRPKTFWQKLRHKLKREKPRMHSGIGKEAQKFLNQLDYAREEEE